MLEKSDIERIVRMDLLNVLTTNTFYHYTEFDTAIDYILINQTLQFSDPKTFNDPFDCNERLLKIDYNDELINKSISKVAPHLNRQKKRELKRSFKNPETQAQIFERERKRFKIACFSDCYNEILMWSHYADKHSGICIGFDFPHRYADKFIMCPVKYLNELNALDGKTDNLRIIMYWLTTKSIRWQYEHEIRAISKSKTSEKHELINFDAQYVKEIIFGCNVSNLKIFNAIRKLKKNNLVFEKVVFKRMRIDETNFLLKEEIL